jgi:uncharacterized protein YqgQ
MHHFGGFEFGASRVFGKKKYRIELKMMNLELVNLYQTALCIFPVLNYKTF